MKKTNPTTLNEELDRIKRLMVFTISENSHDVLSEQGGYGYDLERESVMSTPNWGKRRKGELNFLGVTDGEPTFAFLKNRKLDSRLPSDNNLYITSISAAAELNSYTPPTPPTPDVPDVANIDIKMDLQDPFVFDTTNLTNEAKNNFDLFIDEYNSKKSNFIDVWPKYLEFLKSKSPIIVEGWASRDADPEEMISGAFKACKKDKQKRKDYNLCLSQNRANKIVELLETNLPELKGILKGVGYGETDKFNGIGWTKQKETSPSETAPNRRFLFTLPKFSTDIKGDGDTQNIDKDSQKNVTDYTKKLNQYLDLSPYFGVDAKIPAKEIGNGMVGLDSNALDTLFDSVGSEKFASSLPIWDGSGLNNNRTAKGKILKDGFEIAYGGGKIKFNGWSTTPKKSLLKDISTRISTGFIPVITDNAKEDKETGLRLTPVKLLGIGLSLWTKREGGVNVQR
jgi:outer membrane protein OmpA-like peptidoglycan-associated protein